MASFAISTHGDAVPQLLIVWHSTPWFILVQVSPPSSWGSIQNLGRPHTALIWLAGLILARRRLSKCIVLLDIPSGAGIVACYMGG